MVSKKFIKEIPSCLSRKKNYNVNNINVRVNLRDIWRMNFRHLIC